MTRMKIESPVLFDANILINLEEVLEDVFDYFETILIHKVVYEEVLSEAIRRTITTYQNEKGNIEFVGDIVPKDEIEHKLLTKWEEELQRSFNIRDHRDLGEYKTLLYANYHGITLFSTQDTTVWIFTQKSIYFKGIECIAIQDIAYMLYLEVEDKVKRKRGRNLYRYVSNTNKYPFQEFKEFMEQRDNQIPGFINFINHVNT